MCITAKFTFLALLVTALLGVQHVAAEKPPEDGKNCYKQQLNAGGGGGGQVNTCVKTYYWCPDPKKIRDYWSDWKAVDGSQLDTYSKGGSVGHGNTYTSTTGFFYGGSLAGSTGFLGNWIKNNKALETATYGLTGMAEKMVSTSNAETSQVSANCGNFMSCALRLRFHRLVVTGKIYNHIDSQGLIGCPQKDADKTKDFSMYFPVLVKNATQYAAHIEYSACATKEPTRGYPRCPKGLLLDPGSEAGGRTGKQPNGMACMVNSIAGTCMDADACTKKGFKPLPLEKGHGGKKECQSIKGNYVQCCMDPKKLKAKEKPKPEGPSCTINNKKGVCMDKGKCKGPNKESIPGVKVNGKWTCDGGNNIQCCVDKKGENSNEKPPKGNNDDGKHPKCKISGNRGTCLPTAQCHGTPVPGVKGKEGKWTCPGGNDIQCCVADGVGCSAKGKHGKCLAMTRCDGESVPGKCPGGNDIQCCIGKKGNDNSGTPPKVISTREEETEW